MLDSSDSGVINILEMLNFLKEHEVSFTETELYMSIR